MGNRLEGSARFTYEGATYLLVFNNRTWIEAEEVLGQSILDIVPEIKAALDAGLNPRLKHVVALAYGGLIQSHPDITEDAVIDMVLSKHDGFRNAVLEAMQGAQLPDAEDPGAGEAKAAKAKSRPKAGAGKRSSPRGAKAGSTRKRSG